MKYFKILLVGVITALYRLLVQIPMLMVPQGESVLEPSVFVENGTVGIVFILFAIVLYTITAGLFLLIEGHNEEKPMYKALKYGLVFCIIWVAYLMEPSEVGTNPLDAVTYPLADGSAFIIMGLLLGRFFRKKDSCGEEEYKTFSFRGIFIPAGFFWVGRVILYLVFNGSGQWDKHPIWTMLFIIECGLVVSACIQWLISRIKIKTLYLKALVAGLVFFGINLMMFNGFVLLIFKVDIPGLVLRTVIDVCSFTAGSLINQILYKRVGSRI